MGVKDLIEKILEAHNDVFADIANVFIFDGKQEIHPDDLEDGIARSYYKVDDKFHELERDVVKKVKKDDIHIACIGLENQTVSDADMPLRVIGYDGAEYRGQLLKGKRERYPVVTLVLYFGYKKPWSGPLSLKEYYNIPQKYEHSFKDYSFNLCQVAYLTREQVNLFKSDFRIVADYFVQMRETGKYNGSTQEIKHVYETLQLISVMGHDSQLQKQAELVKNNPQGGPHTMKGYIDEMLESKYKEALAEGKAEGETNGINKLALLMNKLFSLNRIDDAKRVSEDRAYRDDLMKEFGIN